MNIWFWQRIITPHMAQLVVALARQGFDVTYVAEQPMSEDRSEQGWIAPHLPGVRLEFALMSDKVSALVATAPANSIHICQGIRSNGIAGRAQIALAKRGLRQWVVMETVEDSGWRGVLKRLEYRRLILRWRNQLQGVLTTGYRTADWVVARGMPVDCVYPFTYFMPDEKLSTSNSQRKGGPFRFIFAGRLIPLKRVDWLVGALAGLADQAFELWIVGSGPEEPALRALAAHELGDRVRWLGKMPMSAVPGVMAQADCLVLPSVHDGWGAVASEALMTGTPVVCSDACGVAGAVLASGAGGVFPVNDGVNLAHLLADQLARGTMTDEARRQLAAWATCLGAVAGADYLLEILAHKTTARGARPVAPWLKEQSAVLPLLTRTGIAFEVA